MTERLSVLLRQEADTLDVPPPPAADVLRRGRAVRRRGQATSTLGALAVVGIVAGTALVATRDDAGTGSVGPADESSLVDTGATFTVGTTLWYDDATRQATIDDAAVKSLYYTSAGILVRHGDNNWSDGGGPQRFSLVTPSGEVRPLGLVTEEVSHTADPAQPYVAWGEDVEDGSVTVVVHDVSTDQEVARVPVPGAKGDYVSTALDGDLLYVRVLSYDDDRTSYFVVDWRTGEVTPSDWDVSEVGGGRGVSDRSVVDLSSGTTVWAADGEDAYLDLSPDGRYALVQSSGGRLTPSGFEEPTTTLVDLDGGVVVPLDTSATPLGWTAGSELYAVSLDALTTCAPTTGDCTETPIDLGVTREELEQTTRYGGAVYES